MLRKATKLFPISAVNLLKYDVIRFNKFNMRNIF